MEYMFKENGIYYWQSMFPVYIRGFTDFDSLRCRYKWRKTLFEIVSWKEDGQCTCNVT